MKTANFDKLNFGASLNNNPMANDCHNYGSISGCDGYCPALLSGKCPEPKDIINSGCINDDEIESFIKEIYKINP